MNGLSKYQLERAIAYIKAHLTQELNLAQLDDAVGAANSIFAACLSNQWAQLRIHM